MQQWLVFGVKVSQDAEKLLSYATAASMERRGHTTAAEYERTIAQWHEATDGRGLISLMRAKYNNQMLLYILF